jgi:hypothetical protein
MDTAGRRARASRAFLTSDTNPLKLKAGDAIAIGHRDGVWSSYVWGSDGRGHAAWVPEEFVERRGEREAVLLRDYDSSELTVVRGDEFEVLDEAGGWCLCRARSGATGWVPEDVLEPV